MHGPHLLVKYLSPKLWFLGIFFSLAPFYYAAREKTKFLVENLIFVPLDRRVAQAQLVSVIITLLSSGKVQVKTRHFLANNSHELCKRSRSPYKHCDRALRDH